MTANHPVSLTAEQVAEIQARRDAATPGPWTLFEDSTSNATIRARGPAVSGVVATVRVNWVHAHQRAEQAANAAFLAHAPQDISNLLADRSARGEEVERLRAQLAERTRLLVQEHHAKMMDRNGTNTPLCICAICEEFRASLPGGGSRE